MRPSYKHATHFRTALCWLAALAFVFQAFGVGVFTGAIAQDDAPRVICGSNDDGQPTSGSKAPAITHHCAACCILHSSSAIENELAGLPAKVAPDEAQPSLPFPKFHVDAVHVAPELRRLCSRAPPELPV